MGDGGVSAFQCVSNFNALSMYRSWTRSMMDNQIINAEAHPQVSGILATVVPAFTPPLVTGDAAWSYAIAEVVYQLYHQYGATDIVIIMYQSMKNYFQFLVNQTDPTLGIMINQGIYGDWDAAFNRTFYMNNTREICGTSAYLIMAYYLAELCSVAGYPQDQEYYTKILSQSVDKYNNYYGNNLINQNGAYGDGIEQTPTVLPLSLSFVNATYYNLVTNWLINDIETTHNYHLTTGSAGTRYFFDVLTNMGRLDLAAVIAAQDTYPSHGYWITQGGTTCWENWSGVADDQHPPAPTHNHIFLGSHMGWMYEHLLGIQQYNNTYGFNHILLVPAILDTLPSMAGYMHTRKGKIEFAWNWVNNQSSTSMITMNITIPDNGYSTVLIPVLGLINPIITEVYSGINIYENSQFQYINGIMNGRLVTLQTINYIAFDIGSGIYSLQTNHGNSINKDHDDDNIPVNYQISQCTPLFPRRLTASLSDIAINISCKNNYHYHNHSQYRKLYNRIQDKDKLYIDHVLRSTIIITDKNASVAHDIMQQKFLNGKKYPNDSLIINKYRYLLTMIVERLCLNIKTNECIITYQDIENNSYPINILRTLENELINQYNMEISICVKMTCSNVS